MMVVSLLYVLCRRKQLHVTLYVLSHDVGALPHPRVLCTPWRTQ
jgi:hypothetical protein